MLQALLAAGVVTSGGILIPADESRAQLPSKPKRGGRIRVASLSSSTADTLDPAKGALSTDYARHYMLYSGLTQYDSNLQPQLGLAESIANTASTVWIFKLRSGVVFHDGKTLTAADVAYSLLRHKDAKVASKMKTIAEQFQSVKATTPNEVQIQLVSPNADLPTILAASHFLIIKDGTTDFRTAVGTGPYKLKEFNPGVRTVWSEEPFSRPLIVHSNAPPPSSDASDRP
jgi:peptide/nickel transport system substrate-binding protein